MRRGRWLWGSVGPLYGLCTASVSASRGGTSASPLALPLVGAPLPLLWLDLWWGHLCSASASASASAQPLALVGVPLALPLLCLWLWWGHLCLSSGSASGGGTSPLALVGAPLLWLWWGHLCSASASASAPPLALVGGTSGSASPLPLALVGLWLCLWLWWGSGSASASASALLWLWWGASGSASGSASALKRRYDGFTHHRARKRAGFGIQFFQMGDSQKKIEPQKARNWRCAARWRMGA